MKNPLKAGVIGWPITQSRSPLIHNSWLKAHGIDGTYEKYAVEPKNLKSFINNLKENDLTGVNVTIPHKETVMALADIITDEAKAIGAANTLWFEGEKLIAGNTDSFGFITHLKTSAPTWQSNKPALVLGAGGGSRAILYALLEAGVPKIKLSNRTSERAEKLATEFGEKISVVPWEQKQDAMSDCALLVNSTSLGMSGKPPLDLKIDQLSNEAICYDIVYVPLETELLKAARLRGLQAIDGLGMLLHQAVLGFEKWFGTRPTVNDELYQLIIDDLKKTT